MSHGRAPWWASSTIFCLVLSGNGRPFTKTPPSWLTPLWPSEFRLFDDTDAAATAAATDIDVDDIDDVDDDDDDDDDEDDDGVVYICVTMFLVK